MYSRLSRRIMVMSAAVLLATGCHESTAIVVPPAAPFDARHALARVDPLAGVFDQPIFKSFQASLSFFESYFRSPPGAVNASKIPDGVRGKTFVYDVTSASYVIDASATGAPANGVRYVLYDWVPGTGAPALPLTRIGHTEITPLTETDGQSTETVLFRDQPSPPTSS
jgi:hypothetical protein